MDASLLIFGASWHSAPGYNPVNPGAGIEISAQEEVLRPFATFASYYDSNCKPAVFAGVGGRFEPFWGWCSPWFSIGHLTGSGHRDTLAPFAGLEIATIRGIGINAVYFPKALDKDSEEDRRTHVVGVWVRFPLGH